MPPAKSTLVEETDFAKDERDTEDDSDDNDEHDDSR